MAKVAVEVVAPGGLVEGVHGVGGVGQRRVGVETRAAVLYGPAVRPAAAARIVDVGLQRRGARVRPRHAPPPPRSTRGGRRL